MYQTITLKNELDYARFIHLISMYLLAMLFFLFSKIPHSWWILSTTLMITASIEPGLLIGRSFQRIKGTFLAVLILMLLFYLFQLNYRLVPIACLFGWIGFHVAIFSFRRYDLVVFFSTITASLLIAQTSDAYSPEGPLQFVVNRSICTVIGAMIVLFCDHFLFNSFQYSQKLYLFQQRTLYNFLNQLQEQLCDGSLSDRNTYLFIKKLRIQTNKLYLSVETSAESLKSESNTSIQMKQAITLYQEKIGELRQVMFGLCFSKLILKLPKMSEIHLLHYQQLMHELDELGSCQK